MANKLSQTLFRALLRTCKKHDQYPPLKAAMYKPDDVDLPNGVKDALHAVYGEKGIFYKPNVQFVQVLKDAFRENRESTGKVNELIFSHK